MKWLWVVLIAALCACCPVQAPKMVADLNEMTVALVQDDGGRYCAGTWVSSHEILTAAHCVAEAGIDPDVAHVFRMIGFPWDPKGAPVLFLLHQDKEDRSPRHAVVEKFDPKDDLALLETADPVEHPWAQVRVGVPETGEEVHVIGHPMGEFGWTYSHGYISQYRASMDDVDGNKVPRLQIDVSIHPGNSGGGAFDARGRLVGVCSFMVRGQPGLGFFVGSDLIRSFLYV